MENMSLITTFTVIVNYIENYTWLWEVVKATFYRWRLEWYILMKVYTMEKSLDCTLGGFYFLNRWFYIFYLL